MVRLLFVTNHHLNEAFSVGVARRLAEQLQAQRFKLLVVGKDKIPAKAHGDEIVWLQFKPEETLLGQIVRAPEGTEFDHSEVVRLTKTGVAERVDNLVREIRPDIAYPFDCSTPPTGGLKSPDKQAFWITTDYKVGDTPIRTIEINTIYRPAPVRIQEKAKRVTTERAQKMGLVHKYAMVMTSEKAMREAGLHPEKVAAAIGEKMRVDIKLCAAGEPLPFAQGTAGEVRAVRIRPPRKREPPRPLRRKRRRRSR